MRIASCGINPTALIGNAVDELLAAEHGPMTASTVNKCTCRRASAVLIRSAAHPMHVGRAAATTVTCGSRAVRAIRSDSRIRFCQSAHRRTTVSVTLTCRRCSPGAAPRDDRSRRGLPRLANGSVAMRTDRPSIREARTVTSGK